MATIMSLMTTSLRYQPSRLNLFVLLFAMVATALSYSSVLAATEVPATMNWSHMCMGLFGGLALFLFGMEQMSDALKSALGDQMKVLLAKLTSNRFTGALTGAFVTAIIQSSSVTTVLVVGFVSSGMMTLTQSIGVIMGANVGTTMTAQIVAFDVSEAALWMVAFGFLMLFGGKQERIRHYGSMLMGLGLVFYGMSLMGEAMNPLRSYQPFLDLMTKMDHPLLGILVGALFTALVQSSSATTAIVITMAGQGLINLEAGISLALGSNIGTCITALLATLGKPREALRAASVHLIFNIAGVVLWVPLISVLSAWVIDMSPSHPELTGMARLAAEVPRQIANAHTAFNIANTLIFIGFTTYIAWFVDWLLPVKTEEDTTVIRPKFLDQSMVTTPTLALHLVRLEIARMGEIVQQMFTQFRQGMLARNRSMLQEIQKMDAQVDSLEGEILRYLSLVRAQSLSAQDSADIALVMKAANGFRSVGEVVEANLVVLGYRALDQNIQASDTIQHVFTKLGDTLVVGIEAGIRAVRDHDENEAQKVLSMKAEVDHLISQALDLQSQSLAQQEDGQIELLRMEMTALENFKRMHTYIKRIARDVLPTQ